jgi:hypothetical protein
LPQHFKQLGCAKPAGDLKPGEMIGGAAAVLRQHSPETAALRGYSGTSQAGSQRRRLDGAHGKIERRPHPRNLKLLTQPRHGIQNGRCQVRVFVRVEVRGAKSGGNDPADLLGQFVKNCDLAARQRG